MKWAKLFKPTKKKIILFLILFALSFIPIGNAIFETISGLPFIFAVSRIGSTSFNYLNLLYNIIFWYVISCSVLDIYEKVKKK